MNSFIKKVALFLSVGILAFGLNSCGQVTTSSSSEASTSSAIASSISSAAGSASVSSTGSSASAAVSSSAAASSTAVSSSANTSSSSAVVSSSSGTRPQKIAFYSLNDTHGAIEYDASNKFPGMAKVSYQIKNDADYTSDSVLLSSGDMFQGSALSNMSEGLCMTDIMTKMGFASMEIGNHEFDWGTDKIVAEEKKASFPFLGINIYSKTTGKIADFAKPSTIVYRGEAKIGIIGSIYQNISGSISANKITDIDFKDDAPLVNAEAKRLKEEEKCDLVILSTHQGYSSLPYAIGASAYIDGVFGGHDHLATNDYMSNQKYFLEAGSSGKYIAKMVFTLNNGKYEASSGYYTQTDLTSDGDASVQSIIDDYNVKIGPVKNTVIGTRDGELVRYASSANTSKYGSLNKLVVNAMMYYARVTCNDSTVVCAFHNYGGVRADMQGTTLNASGTYDITIGDLYTVSPFDNLVQKIKILGSNLTAASSSLSFSSDELKKVNNTWYLSGTEVVADQYYWVTTIDYMITKPGQPLYTTDAASVQNISGYQSFIRDVVTSYIQHLGTVRVADLNFNSTCTYK